MIHLRLNNTLMHAHTQPGHKQRIQATHTTHAHYICICYLKKKLKAIPVNHRHRHPHDENNIRASHMIMPVLKYSSEYQLPQGFGFSVEVDEQINDPK